MFAVHGGKLVLEARLCLGGVALQPGEFFMEGRDEPGDQFRREQLMALQSANYTKVPPPTRGWSQREEINAAVQQGSPAHAGMVPIATRPPTAPMRFPRPRGDGPSA